MRRLHLAVPVALCLATSFVACSPATSTCSAATCANGCCDSTGTCQSGSSSLACGAAGAMCVACELGATCTLGQCTIIGASGGGTGSTGGGSGGGGGTTGGGGGTTGGGGGTTGGGGGATGGGGGTGGGGATGGGGGMLDPCAGSLTLCGMRCLDLAADPENCGRCGNICGQGQVCNRGTCGVLPDDCTTQSNGCGAGYFCDPVSKRCNTGCRLTTDCPMGAACNAGTCACPTGQHACGQQCVPDDEATSCGSRCSACAQPAQSVATCVAGACDFTCNTGYRLSGGQCVDVDECATGNGGCSPNARCTNTPGARTCACNAGFTGDGLTCTDVNECATNNGGCANEATCTNTPGARTCTCGAGYTGDGLTCADVNECGTNNGGCAQAATCTNTAGSRTCACNAGYTGDGFACTDVNECATNNGGCAATSAGGVCTNTPGSRTCTCAAGFMGDGLNCTDVNECATNNGGCAATTAGGVCTNTTGSRTCACASGFTGNGFTCTDVNECTTNNGGCAAVSAGGVCLNTPGSRTCSCASGFTGDGFSCADVNECSTNNGGCAATTSGGVCTNTTGSRTCACATGWTGNGFTCADVNECNTNNGGCAATTAGGVCTNTPGSRTCACATGWTGNGLTCADVNECNTNNGGCAAVNEGGVCTNTQGSRTCACASGWTGNGLTCADVNECNTNNGGCSVNATCANTSGSRTCTCNTGYTGNGVTCTPNGDTCAAPIVLTLNTPFSSSTIGAVDDINQALSPVCDGATLAGPDTVHVFAPAATGNYRATFTGTSSLRAWVGTSCGVPGSCVSTLPGMSSPQSMNFRGTAGVPLYLVVDSTSSTSSAYTVTLSAIGTVANDTCATAAPLTLGVPVSGTFANAVNDLTPLASCGSTTYTQPELVYSFTPSVTGEYVLRETTSSDVVMWIASTCDGACVVLEDEPETVRVNLTAGTPYFVFVEPYTTSAGFTLQLEQLLAPANDTCSNPIALPESTTVTASTLGAANDYEGPLSAACSGISTPGADVVYSFTPATTGSYLVSLTGSTDVWVSTTCGDAASCVAVEHSGSPHLVFRGTANTPVFIVVDRTSAGTNDFGISVAPVTAPPNDTCATAQPLTLGVPFSGSTAGAADDLTPVVACETNRRAGDVMFTFTPPTTGPYLLRETTGADLVMWLGGACDGTCSASIDEPEELLFDGTAGVPVSIVLEPYSNRGPYTVEVASGSPPANDVCAGAQALTLGTPVTATTTIATSNYDGPLSAACGSLTASGRELVYSFTPAASGNFTITTNSSNGWTPTVWTSPACGVASSCTWAAPSGQTQVVRGTAGTPFFITVDAFDLTDFGPFTLTLNSITAPANDTCASATPLTANTPVTGTTVGAVNDVVPQSSCTQGARRTGEVVYTFTPPTTGTWVFRETTGSDVVMWVSTACDGTCSLYDDEPEELRVSLTAGTPYYLFVEPYSSAGAISVVVSQN